jgi:anti-anti-sigma factor
MTTAYGMLCVTVSPPAGDPVTVTARGEIDLASASVLTGVLMDQFARGHRFVRLDMSAVTFLDCTGLRAIVDAHNAFLDGCGALELSGVGLRVSLLMCLTNLDEALFILSFGSHARGRPPTGRHLHAVP